MFDKVLNVPLQSTAQFFKNYTFCPIQSLGGKNNLLLGK